MQETIANIEEKNIERYGVRGGAWDLSNLDGTTEEEIQAHLHQWLNYTRVRGIYYGLNALSFLADNRPDFAKLASLGQGGIPEGLLGHPSRPLLQNVRVLSEYVRLGWESGIYNEFRELQQLRGLTKQQIIEIVMFAQLTGGGIRSMGHVHNAVGKSLYDWRDGEGAIWPEGWAPDNAAFRAGLDLTVGHMTEQDSRNITEWYEKTIGWVPKSVRFGLKHNPRYMKAQRAKWESVFKLLPKQVAPFLMLADQTLRANREGLREAALLAKAWGFTKDWAVEPVCGMAYYFRSHDILEAPFDALDDILDNWDR
jgi:hypothetical protein